GQAVQAAAQSIRPTLQAVRHSGPTAATAGKDEAVCETLLRCWLGWRAEFRFRCGDRWLPIQGLWFPRLGPERKRDFLPKLFLDHILDRGTAEVLEFVLQLPRGRELHAAVSTD